MSDAVSVLHTLFTRKAHEGVDPIVMVTAYDAPTAHYAAQGGADVILVGDSAAMVMLGYESTMHMKHEEMLMLVRAVSRSEKTVPIIADMVWGSYHVSDEEAVAHAVELVHAGAHAVKIEGGADRAHTVAALVAAHIPVVGHIGLTPQSVLEFGGYHVQGKDLTAAQNLLSDAKAVGEAGASMLVVECVPDALSRAITEEISIPVIGIGAGRHVDGQVLVMHDLIGMRHGHKPKFVRQYSDVESVAIEAVKTYASDVRSGTFPSAEETYHMADDVVAELQRSEEQQSGDPSPSVSEDASSS